MRTRRHALVAAVIVALAAGLWSPVVARSTEEVITGASATWVMLIEQS